MGNAPVTATVTTLFTEAYQDLTALLAGTNAVKYLAFRDCRIENLGDVSLYIVILSDDTETVSDANRITLGAGQSKTFSGIDPSRFFMRTEDDSGGVGSNRLEFEGQPVFLGDLTY
jgi:ferredoxin-NADP reductase